jgi:hypothetical protein
MGSLVDWKLEDLSIELFKTKAKRKESRKKQNRKSNNCKTEYKKGYNIHIMGTIER